MAPKPQPTDLNDRRKAKDNCKARHPATLSKQGGKKDGKS